MLQSFISVYQLGYIQECEFSPLSHPQELIIIIIMVLVLATFWKRARISRFSLLLIVTAVTSLTFAITIVSKRKFSWQVTEVLSENRTFFFSKFLKEDWNKKKKVVDYRNGLFKATKNKKKKKNWVFKVAECLKDKMCNKEVNDKAKVITSRTEVL